MYNDHSTVFMSSQRYLKLFLFDIVVQIEYQRGNNSKSSRNNKKIEKKKYIYKTPIGEDDGIHRVFYPIFIYKQKVAGSHLKLNQKVIQCTHIHTHTPKHWFFI